MSYLSFSSSTALIAVKGNVISNLNSDKQTVVMVIGEVAFISARIVHVMFVCTLIPRSQSEAKMDFSLFHNT